MLWCEVDGKPLSNVTWKKDGTFLSSGGRITITNPSVVGRANSTLTINNLKKTDQGLYTCTVKNILGTVASPSTSGRLTVCKLGLG